jgi:predicted transcriptional regulator
VRHILNTKGNEVEPINPDDTVLVLLRRLQKRFGALVVMESDAICGIITERHDARNVFLKGKSSPDTLVKEIIIKQNKEYATFLCVKLKS